MFATAPVNDDPGKCAVMDTTKMSWEPTKVAGVSIKSLERVIDPRKGRETVVVKMEPGAALPAETLQDRLELFVLEGSVADEHGTYTAETYVWNPPGTTLTLKSDSGCVMYVKRRVPIYKDDAQRPRRVIDSKTATWLDFPHRGASVLHLHKDPNGLETGRIGNVHPNRKLPWHDHSIGEETFVIDGCMKDENHSYTKGVWFRMGCGIPHAPYTEDKNAKMLIREGDLVW